MIGVGLLGGSFALALREHGFADHIVGVDLNADNAAVALDMGLVDEILPLDEAVRGVDMVIIAIPVDKIPAVAVAVLDALDRSKIVVDLGSTKTELCEAIANHSLRDRFVATHPMWGTEHSGPAAAVSGAFAGRGVVICERERSAEDALAAVEAIYRAFGMAIHYMNCEEHDLHAAYVSHISHITSFALALTVLEKEREDDAIFNLAGGGFESTVRLAKSSPDMWVPILMQNKYNVLEVLRENIHQLNVMRKMIESDDVEALRGAMEKANTIKRIL